MFAECFTILMDDNSSEELDPEELRLWFKQRGANMDAMEKVFDHVWNFGFAEVVIANPKQPTVNRLPYYPDI